MADNVTLNAGSGGAVAAADDISGVMYQRVKLTLGADGDNDGDVSASNPIPVKQIPRTTDIQTTTTPLSGGATYTSQTFDTVTYGTFVAHFVYADVAGTHYFEESIDGSTWYVTDEDAVEAGAVFSENHITHARYHRARFVNGAAAQSTFVHSVMGKSSGSNAYTSVEAVSEHDSSSTNLASGATWTSQTFDTHQGIGWAFFIYADQNGTYDIEESTDAVTWHNMDTGSSSSGTAFGETQVAKARYFRFKWTNNGGVATTTFHAFVRQLSIFTGIPESITLSSTGNYVQQGGDTPWEMQGLKTYNAAGPTGDNFGALVGVANAARPSFTEGYQTLLSQLLNGCLRVQEDGTATHGSPSQVATSGTSAQLIASNTSRKGLIIHNDASAVLYVKFGTTASSTSYTYALQPGGMFEMARPIYTGRVDAILATGSGNAMVTEMT